VRGKVLSGMRGYGRPFSEILVAVLEEGLAIYDLSDEIDEHHNWNYRMGEWCGKTGVHRAHDYERKHTCPGVTLESKDDGTFRLGKTPKPRPTSEPGVGDSSSWWARIRDAQIQVIENTETFAAWLEASGLLKRKKFGKGELYGIWCAGARAMLKRLLGEASQVGDSPPAMLGEERGSEPVNASPSPAKSLRERIKALAADDRSRFLSAYQEGRYDAISDALEIIYATHAVSMYAERIAALRAAAEVFETFDNGDDEQLIEDRKMAVVLRAILRDAGADE